MSNERKRGSLKLDGIKPGSRPVDPADHTRSDAIAEKHGFTSREGDPVSPSVRRPGRPARKQPRKQLNFVANLPDIEWFSARREEMGVNGAKLFEEMRAAYEREIGAKNNS